MNNASDPIKLLQHGNELFCSIDNNINQSETIMSQIEKSLHKIHQSTQDFEISCGNAQKEEAMLRAIVEDMDKYLSYYDQVKTIEEYFAILNSKMFSDSEFIPKYMQLQELLDFFSSHIDFMESDANIMTLTQIKLSILKCLLSTAALEFKKHKSSLTSMIILEVNLNNAQPSLIESIIYQHNSSILPLCSIFKFIMNDANKRKDIECINIMSEIKEIFVGNRFSLSSLYFNSYQNLLKGSFIEDFASVFKHLNNVVNKEVNYYMQYFRESCSILQEYKDSLLRLGLEAFNSLISSQQSIEKLISAIDIVETQSDSFESCIQHNRGFAQQVQPSID